MTSLVYILVYFSSFKVGCYHLLDIHDPEVATGYHVACMATCYILYSDGSHNYVTTWIQTALSESSRGTMLYESLVCLLVRTNIYSGL